MKNISIILLFCSFILSSCYKEKEYKITFKDVEKNSILDYITQDKQYSKFLEILQKAGLDKTLSAYNPNANQGDGYTLFLPNNEAIDSFVLKSQFGSYEEMLNDENFIWFFARYHVVNEAINSNDFPFGAFSSLTLTKDYLSVSFIIETDSSYYKINNEAPVIQPNIEMSNGYIHLIKIALTPITNSTYGWLQSHPGFTIFRDAVEATGFSNLLSINSKEDENGTSLTLLLEPDSVFNKAGITNFSDLAHLISPGRADYTDNLNPLYNFVGYHVLNGSYFLEDFQENDNGDRISTNYSTYSDIPLHIDGTGNDIKINKGKQMFDTIVNSPGDTTFINYIGFNYDQSNVITQSGVVHFIDHVMKQVTPSKAIQTYEIKDNYFWQLWPEVGTYLIEDSTVLSQIKYTGADLSYVLMTAEEAPGALWSDDYINLDGDFTVSFTTNKMVQGDYTVFFQADFFNSDNAVIEIFIDGKAVGGTVDLANDPDVTGTADAPFGQKELGTISFVKYQAHTITIRTLIPGNFSWDYIRFEPL